MTKKNLLSAILCIGAMILLNACSTDKVIQTTRIKKLPVININDLPVHDPFILVNSKTKTYIMYKGYSPPRTPDSNAVSKYAGVVAYTSKDLVKWNGPILVFEIPEGFWADRNSGPWARRSTSIKANTICSLRSMPGAWLWKNAMTGL